MSRGQSSGNGITSAWLFKLTSVLYPIYRLWQGKMQSSSEDSPPQNICMPFRHWKIHPTTHWDDLLVHLLTSKFYSLTLCEWRTSLAGNESSLKQLLDFIAHRCQVLEPIGLTLFPQGRSRQNRSQMLSDHHARPPLNLNATSVKENTIYLLLQKFRGTSSITKGRGNSQSQTLRQLLALLFSCIK